MVIQVFKFAGLNELVNIFVDSSWSGKMLMADCEEACVLSWIMILILVSTLSTGCT